MTVMTPEGKSLRINVLKRQRSAIDAEIVRLGGDVSGNPMWECNQCGHRWAGMTPLPPKQCPRKGCRSAYWDRPKSQTRADRAMGQETEVPRVVVAEGVRKRTSKPPTIESPLPVIWSEVELPPDLPPPPVPTRIAVVAPSQPTVERAIEEYENGVGRGHAVAVENVPAAEETMVEHGDDTESDAFDDLPDANDTADEADADGNVR